LQPRQPMSRSCRRSRGGGGPAGSSTADNVGGGGGGRGSVVFAMRDFFRQIGGSGSGGSRKRSKKSTASALSGPASSSSVAVPGPSGLSTAAAAAAANSASSDSIASGCPEQRRSPAAAFADIAGLVECPVCTESLPLAQFPPMLLDCDHFACHACLRTSMRLCISEGLPATCLSCNNRLHPADVDSIVDEERLRLKYEQFTLRRVLAADPDCRWCPAPDCKYAVIATGCASCPQLECPVCRIQFCYHCKTEWHPSTTCEQARIERQTAEVLAAARAGADILSLSSRSESIAEIKQCPRCATYITKENDGSCNHMRCKMCGSEFCWLCRKEITDLHYLSPSGCTFWGKKPWSRKKKILWQLGTLIGAPIGIALLAGLAVPAITMGVPVWVGQQANNRLKRGDGLLRRSRARRHCLVTVAVCGSALLSPVVAVLSVGVSVPILLAYVYGVVPVSLCRANGCGILQDEDPEDDDEDMELHGTADADQGLSFSSRSGSRPVVDLMAGHRGGGAGGNSSAAGSTSGAVAPAASVERDLASGCSQADAQTEESISLVLVSSGREAKVAAAGAAAGAAASAAAVALQQQKKQNLQQKLKKQQWEDESHGPLLLPDQQSDGSNSIVSFSLVASGCSSGRQRHPASSSSRCHQQQHHQHHHHQQQTTQAEVLAYNQHCSNANSATGASAAATGCRVGSFESLDDKRSCSLSVYTVDTNDASMLGLTGSIAGGRDPDGKSISIISEDRQPIELPTAQAQAHNQLANCDAAAGEPAMATVAMDASDSACRRCSLSAASAGYARDQVVDEAAESEFSASG
ncbi:hypothetical protein BOX15_Mlig015207g1, partial [Macrostomum lignano]